MMILVLVPSDRSSIALVVARVFFHLLLAVPPPLFVVVVVVVVLPVAKNAAPASPLLSRRAVFFASLSLSLARALSKSFCAD